MAHKTAWIEAGAGGEAHVLKGALDEIEGIGGIVTYKNPIVVAKRINNNEPIHEYEGHDLFCKHLTLRILDEYFLKKREYLQHHIPAPLGSFNGGYYYQFVNGSEGFPLEITDEDYNPVPVQIDEWNSFVALFNSFGFRVNEDIADVFDGRSGKNAIFNNWDINQVYETGRLHSNWKRIDFGSASCPFNYETFENEMKIQRRELTDKMENYRLALLAAKYYYLNQLNGKLSDEESKELERLVLQFREKILL